MDTIIDLNSELLIDRSRIRSPHVRLLLTALGQELARGSAWVALNKKVLSQYAKRMCDWSDLNGEERADVTRTLQRGKLEYPRQDSNL